MVKCKRFIGTRCNCEDLKKVFNEFSSEELIKIFKFLKEGNGREVIKRIFNECSRIGIITEGIMPDNMPIMLFIKKIEEKTGKKPSNVDVCIRFSFSMVSKILSKNPDFKENYVRTLLMFIYKIKEESQYYFTDGLKNFLEDIIKDENYLDVVLIVKIISELNNFSLKGKSLEEYRESIISECKKILENEKNKGEKGEKQNEN